MITLSAPDPLANAALTPEQRQAWETTRADLATAREQIRDLEKRLKALEQQTPDDSPVILTRPEFNREVARMLAFDDRYGGTSSILYFNFENMSAIGARYGKSVVNAAVREITNQFLKQVRGSDIIGRLAPDEFGILLTRCSNADAWKKGKQLANDLARTLASVHGFAMEPQISYGAYTFHKNEDAATGLKEAAHLVTRSGPATR